MTEHFTFEELCRSEKAKELGIDNTPPQYIRTNLLFTMTKLERVRYLLNKPMIINSGYRCPKLNAIVGGQINSQHLQGKAVDFICPMYGPPIDICKMLELKMKILEIDQLIMEGTWVHVSFDIYPRGEALTLKDGKYLRGIV